MKKTAALSLVALAMMGTATAPTSPAVDYAQPVEHAATGPLSKQPDHMVLPSGRVTTPIGRTATIDGTIDALRLSPDDKFVLLTGVTGKGARLRSLSALSLRPVSTLSLKVPSSGGGLVVLPGRGSEATRLYVSTGASGSIAQAVLAKNGFLRSAGPDLFEVAGEPAAKPERVLGALASSPDGESLYALDELGAKIEHIDLRSQTLAAETAVGLAPHALVRIGTKLGVTNEGLVVPAPLSPFAPQYPAPILDLGRASSADLMPLDASGGVGTVQPVPLDPTPRGAIVGGAHPTAICAGPKGIAFLAMSSVDRIAVLDTQTGKVIGGTELRFYDRGPYGTQPVALVYDAKKQRLYAALAGMNAVAVLDVHAPAHPHRLGLLPSGYRPTSLAISSDGQQLYIASERGVGARAAAIVQHIEIATVDMTASTRSALKNVRRIVPAVDVASPDAVVVQIRMPAANYDDVFGPAPRFGTTVMPHVHALAKMFVLASNFATEATGVLAAEQAALSGQMLPYTLRTETMQPEERWEGSPTALGPNDAPRFGYIFDALMREHIPVRNYGALSRMARYTHISDDIYSAALASGRATACAAEFLHDHAVHPARFIEIALPDMDSGVDSVAAAHEADAALGQIMTALQKDPNWPHMTVFISPWRTSGSPDRQDPQHSYAVIAQAGLSAGHIDVLHRSPVSILKTAERLLGVKPMSLGDLLASPFSAGELTSNG